MRNYAENYPTAKELSSVDLQHIIRKQHGSADSVERMPNGDVLVRVGTTMTKIKSTDIQKMVQREIHQDGINQESNTTQVKANMTDLEKQGYDISVTEYDRTRGIREGNPFHGRRTEAQKLNGQSTFGSPTAVLSNQHQGLPSEQPNAPRGHKVDYASPDNPNAGLLPSDRNFKR